jgi:hypothetical protein
MLKQSQLVGVLYLENRLSPRACAQELASVSGKKCVSGNGKS